MIVDYRDRWLESFFVDDTRSRQIPSNLEASLFRRLQMLDDATSTRDLLVPPSNRLERLRGHLEGLCSIRVNRQWRLVFQLDDDLGEATSVYLDDHSYR